jgi:ribosome biogenesis GTPase A
MQENKMTVQWFPGHMARALREIGHTLKHVDLVIETCDARIPESSRNPKLRSLLNNKPLILVLNKSDLADPDITRQWIDAFSRSGFSAIACDSLRRTGIKPLINRIHEAARDKQARAQKRGRRFRPIRVLVVGIPNTGKSALINAISRRKAARTADTPGVTRQLNWIRTDGTIELMDSPGVLWPRIEEDLHRLHLAATGAIRDTLLPIEEIAGQTFQELLKCYPNHIHARYTIDSVDDDPWVLLEKAARSRGCLMSGGRADITRFSVLFLDEFRGGKIGRLSLEKPNPND